MICLRAPESLSKMVMTASRSNEKQDMTVHLRSVREKKTSYNLAQKYNYAKITDTAFPATSGAAENNGIAFRGPIALGCSG